jgi:hypothetical protein
VCLSINKSWKRHSKSPIDSDKKLQKFHIHRLSTTGKARLFVRKAVADLMTCGLIGVGLDGTNYQVVPRFFFSWNHQMEASQMLCFLAWHSVLCDRWAMDFPPRAWKPKLMVVPVDSLQRYALLSYY